MRHKLTRRGEVGFVGVMTKNMGPKSRIFESLTSSLPREKNKSLNVDDSTLRENIDI